MNVEMWENPATQRNVAQLRADGIPVLGPAQGAQACGETGYGRMLEPDELLDDIVRFFQPKPMAGKRVLLTAGPTFEPIDPVRGITNLSSGKTGFALARAARDAGADVTIVAGPTPLVAPRGVKRVDVTSASEMHDAVMRALPADVFIGVAAVADWRVANPSDRKIKKNAKSTPPALQFEPNVDILAAVAALPAPPFCVGFAAESEDVVDNARKKLTAKKVPLVVANRAQDTLAGANNFRANYVNLLTRNTFLVKVDHNLGAKDKLSGRYLYNSDDSGNTSVYPDVAADTNTGTRPVDSDSDAMRASAWRSSPRP